MLTKSERTRLHIIEKSAHLFNTKGFSGTSMSDILDTTGLAKGGVYGHFKTKEEIALEAFEYSYRKVADALVIRIKSAPDAGTKLISIIDYYYDYLDTSPIEGGCPILNYSGFIHDTFPELKTAIYRASQTMLDTLTRILEKGKEMGQIKAHVDAVKTADILYSRIEGALMLAKASGKKEKLNFILDDIKKYIHELIKLK